MGIFYNKRLMILLMTVLLVGCCRQRLYVQQEWVDASFLASSHVHTPDPRSQNPPQGQRLLISWEFPYREFQKGINLAISVRFWDESHEELSYELQKRRGYYAHFFPNKRILTYLVQAITHQGEVIQTWKHHFWTQEIHPDGH